MFIILTHYQSICIIIPIINSRVAETVRVINVDKINREKKCVYGGSRCALTITSQCTSLCFVYAFVGDILSLKERKRLSGLNLIVNITLIFKKNMYWRNITTTKYIGFGTCSNHV